MTEILPPIVGLPVKPFGVAKQRLQPRVGPGARSILGREIAARTAAVAAGAGAAVVIVTGDGGVRRWAMGLGYEVVDEGPRGSLDTAAAALVEHARSRARRWVVLHADLPLITLRDVGALLDGLAAGRAILAPSRDGGSSAVGGWEPIRFAYGPGSFHRHHRQLPAAAVIVRPGLAWDLDTVTDLDLMLRFPGASWLRELLAAIGSTP